MLQTECRRDATRYFLRLLCASILAAAIAGCADTPTSKGIPWWPQGPGSTAEDVPQTSDTGLPGADHDSPSSSTQPAHRDAHAVRYGDLLFVSGQVAAAPAPESPGSAIEGQVRSAMDNVVRILESHGLAISNIVSVTLYMRDIAELSRADAVYASYFRRGLPARSVVGVNGLPNGSLVEIAVIAGK
jgi:Putative translation initiation inhibitor, yjgF family